MCLHTQFDMKKISLVLTAVLLCLALCSCSADRVKGTYWENEWGSVTFSEEGVLTIKTQDTEQIFYYTDKKGEKDNCYVITYKTPSDAEKGENGVFIPYYIRNKELYFKGECYGIVK